jgi:hypothetical protein
MRTPKFEDLSRRIQQEDSKFPADRLQVGSDFLCFVFPYKVLPPKTDEVRRALEDLLVLVQNFAEPFNGRCEICQGACPDIYTYEDVPVHYCPSCQQRMSLDAEQAAEEFNAIPLKLGRGFVFGAVAALGCGLLREGITQLLSNYYHWTAFGVGVVVPWAVSYGMLIEREEPQELRWHTKIMLGPHYSKTGVLGKIMALLLTAFGVATGNLIRILVEAIRSSGPSGKVGADLVSGAIATAILTTLYLPAALLGTALVLSQMRQPKFANRIRKLDGTSS